LGEGAMEKITNEFYKYLVDLLSLYDFLGNLISEETEILIKREVSRLEKITEEKQTILNKIEELEVQGYNIQKDISLRFCKDGSILTLREISLSLPPSQSDKFQDIRLKLKTSYNKITRINRINSTLIKKYLDFSAFYIKKLRNLSDNSTYSPSGKLSSKGGGVSFLFQKKV
jgi:flagellar biosynthesis/type III secretory pathway chaperone